MAPRVSVLVPPAAAASRSLLSSLDRQDLPAAAFEVLIADDGRDATLTGRLEDVIAHRTNIVRIPVPADISVEDLVATLLERAAGGYVVAVPADRRLTASALSSLADHADNSSADTVLGLTGRAGVRPARVTDDGRHGGPAGRLRRVSALDPVSLAADLESTADDADTAVLSAVCFVDGPAPAAGVPETAAAATHVEASSATWRDGVLEVIADVTGPAAELRASIYAPASGVEWPLTDLAVDGARLTLRIDPEHVPGAGRLPAGIWWPTFRTGEGPETATLVHSRPKLAHGATISTRTVVSFVEDRRLGLDVGGQSHQPIRRLAARATAVVEDDRGSLLTSPLSNVDLAPGTRVEGRLRMGTLPVVAWIEHLDGTGPVLRAWVSGLAGATPLATRFGPAPYRRSGTRLVIGGLGAMRVASSRRKSPAQAPAKAPSLLHRAKRAVSR